MLTAIVPHRPRQPYTSMYMSVSAYLNGCQCWTLWVSRYLSGFRLGHTMSQLSSCPLKDHQLSILGILNLYILCKFALIHCVCSHYPVFFSILAWAHQYNWYKISFAILLEQISISSYLPFISLPPSLYPLPPSLFISPPFRSLLPLSLCCLSLTHSHSLMIISRAPRVLATCTKKFYHTNLSIEVTGCN